jgi:IS66 C-terminal element
MPAIVNDDILPDMGRMTARLRSGAKILSSPAPMAAAVIASLIETCKMNGVDPQAYLRDVLARIVARHPMGRIDQLLPFAYVSAADKAAADNTEHLQARYCPSAHGLAAEVPASSTCWQATGPQSWHAIPRAPCRSPWARLIA